MSVRRTHHNLVWIDLERPSPEEVRALMQEFSLDPLLGEELLSPSVRPKAEKYPDYLYVVLHFALGGASPSIHEIDCIVGKRFLITARYAPLPPLDAFAKTFDVHAALAEGERHAGHLFLALVRALYRAGSEELEEARKALTGAEQRIFDGEEKHMVAELSNIARGLLSSRNALRAHAEVLSSLEPIASSLFGDAFGFRVRALMGDHAKVYSSLLSNYDFLDELRETNNSLLAVKQNEVMKVLTVLAFIILPLTLLTQLFSTRAVGTPIVGSPGDFWTILAMLLVLGAILAYFFKKKGWL